MILLLKLLFLFAAGSMIGWGLEVLFRQFAHHKWVNPGFLTGPCLPLYGFSLCVLYLLAQIDVSFITNPILEKIVLFILMAICITLVEYFAGLIFIKGMKVKLWDYSDQKGNFQGIICPLFSFFWLLLSATYYFFIHPFILDGIDWLVHHIEFSFVIGVYYGVLAVDLAQSLNVVSKIRKFAVEKQIVVRLESYKESITSKKFMFPLYTEFNIMHENLTNYLDKEKENYTRDKLLREQKEIQRRKKIAKKVAAQKAKLERKEK